MCYITLHNHFEYFQIWSWVGPKFVCYSTMIMLGMGHYTMNGFNCNWSSKLTIIFSKTIQGHNH